MGLTLMGVVKHMACRLDLTQPFPSSRSSINLCDRLPLIDGLSFAAGLMWDKQQRVRFFYGHEILASGGLENMTSQEFPYYVLPLKEEDFEDVLWHFESSRFFSTLGVDRSSQGRL